MYSLYSSSICITNITAWDMETRSGPQFRPGSFPNRPPTGPMHGPGGQRGEYHDWENQPPDAPFSHRMRPPFRTGGPPDGSHHLRSGRDASIDRSGSEREEERERNDRESRGSERHGYDSRESRDRESRVSLKFESIHRIG